MTNDPKLVACAAAMVAHLNALDKQGGSLDSIGDVDQLAAVAMASLGVEFDWVDHDGSDTPPVDAKDLIVDVHDGDDENDVTGWHTHNVVWKHVKRWRPSLDSFR